MSDTAVFDGTTVVLPVTPQHAPAPVNSANLPHEDVFTAEQVAAIRQQEKNKLYPQIDGLKEKLEALERQTAAFQADKDEAARQLAEQQHAAQEAQRIREESELSAKELLLVKEKEFNARFEQMQAETQSRLDALQHERDMAAALLVKEQEFHALNVFKQRRLAEEADNIAPIFTDMVTGNTEEEIERSISLLVAKTSDMMEAIQQQQAPAPKLRSVSPAGAAPSGPLENDPSQKTFTLDEIKNMPNDVFAQYREQLQAAVSPNRRS